MPTQNGDRNKSMNFLFIQFTCSLTRGTITHLANDTCVGVVLQVISPQVWSWVVPLYTEVQVPDDIIIFINLFVVYIFIVFVVVVIVVRYRQLVKITCNFVILSAINC